MDDKQLAESLVEARSLEQRFRRVMETTQDINERSFAEVSVRQSTATRRSIESWISARVMRANGVQA